MAIYFRLGMIEVELKLRDLVVARSSEGLKESHQMIGNNQ